MARANPFARKLLARVVAPLVKDYGGAPKVAKAVGRHRSTVTRWVKGDIDWDGLTELASGLRRDIVVTFPAHGRPTATTKEPPPKWAEGLMIRDDAVRVIDALARTGALDSTAQRLVDAVLAALVPPPAASPTRKTPGKPPGPGQGLVPQP